MIWKRAHGYPFAFFIQTSPFMAPSGVLGSVLEKDRFLADGLSEDLAHGLDKKTSSNTFEFGNL